MTKASVLQPWAFTSRKATVCSHARLLTAVLCEVVFGLRSKVVTRPRALAFLAAVEGIDELPVSRAVAILTGEMAFFGMSALQLARRYDESYLSWGDSRLRRIDFDRIRSLCGAGNVDSQAPAK